MSRERSAEAETEETVVVHKPRRVLRELSRDECLALLRGNVNGYVGRIAYVVGGTPVIVPVNFVLDGETVVFCTAGGTKLDGLRRHRRIAFQADQTHTLDESGWSVLIRGTAREITDPAELRDLRRGPLSWAVAPTEHWMRITSGEISGRWLGRRPAASTIAGRRLR
jgi:nitroimidazol reductase NimA-like FMN-containing flavoprotein (pyridoxamine 5'-phosphate oxidase superfamily)